MLLRGALPLHPVGGHVPFAGLCPCTPSEDTSPEPPFERAALISAFSLTQAPRGSRFLRKPAPCGRGGCAARSPRSAIERSFGMN